MKALVLLSILLVAGCATCQEHKVACTVGAIVAAGAVAAVASSSHSGGGMSGSGY